MRARVVVFPIRGRNWCFTRSIDPAAESVPSSTPTRLRDLLKNMTSSGRPAPEKAELVVDFVSDKMNRAWATLEKAPVGSLMSKIHSLGLLLLSRVNPSEVFLKSISKDVTGVDITYPSSLNPRLVRKRLRHIAMRGSANHRKYLYGSVSLLPLTSALTVLPLPNVPFFWILFRAYSHWKALKGSERLLLLVSDCTRTWSLIISNENGHDSVQDSENGDKFVPISPRVLKPSKDFDKVLVEWKSDDGISNSTICSICKEYNLDKKHVLKYKTSL